MAETSNQITHQFLDVTETEQAGTTPGERTNFGGINFKIFEEVPRDSDGKIVADYTVAYFTTGAVAGLTADFKYRRIRVPTVYDPYKVTGFFTNIEQGFVGQFTVIKRHQTDEYTEYDLFFSWQTGQGGTPVASADLYIQQQATQDDGSQIVQYPDFPQSTDPFQGGNAKNNDAGTDAIFDTFLLALPLSKLLPVVRAKGIQIMNIINSGMVSRSPLFAYIEKNQDKIIKITVEIEN